MNYSFQLDETVTLHTIKKVSIIGLGTLAVSAIILKDVTEKLIPSQKKQIFGM
jgi:hypothetical protein